MWVRTFVRYFGWTCSQVNLCFGKLSCYHANEFVLTEIEKFLGSDRSPRPRSQDVVCAWLFSNEHWIKEFLQHSREFRGVLGQASMPAMSKQAGKHLEDIQPEPCPVWACLLLLLLSFKCFKMFHSFFRPLGQGSFRGGQEDSTSLNSWSTICILAKNLIGDILKFLEFIESVECRCYWL